MFLVYAFDYLSVRYLARHNHSPLGSVDIQVYYSVGIKGNKVEYMPADPETQTCVHSLFPQMGYQPCWYLNRHRTQWIDVCRLEPPAHRAQVSARPPSIAYVTPVIHDAWSDARNTINSATSSGCATRPRGCVVLLCCRNFS